MDIDAHCLPGWLERTVDQGEWMNKDNQIKNKKSHQVNEASLHPPSFLPPAPLSFYLLAYLFLLTEETEVYYHGEESRCPSLST